MIIVSFKVSRACIKTGKLTHVTSKDFILACSKSDFFYLGKNWYGKKIIYEHLLQFSMYKSDNLKYNTLVRWFAGLLGQMTHCTSVWCSKHYFFYIISHRPRALKTLYWLTSHLSQQSSEPAWYIVDFWILKLLAISIALGNVYFFFLSLFGIRVAEIFPFENAKIFHVFNWIFFAISSFAIIKESPQQQQTDLWRGVAFQIESWYQIRTDYPLSLNTNCFFLFGFLDTYVLMKKYFVIMIIHIK